MVCLVCIDQVHVVCYFLLLGEHLSVEVSLLLIETYMSTYRLSKAASQIGLLEVKLYGGPLGAGNGKAEGEGEGPAQQCRPQLHLFKARLHLLHKNVKACKKEVKNFISTAGNVSSMIVGHGIICPVSTLIVTYAPPCFIVLYSSQPRRVGQGLDACGIINIL